MQGTLDWCTSCLEEQERGEEVSCAQYREDARQGDTLYLDWNGGLWKKQDSEEIL